VDVQALGVAVEGFHVGCGIVDYQHGQWY